MSLNVAIYSRREFNVHIGGIERVSVSLANELIKRGVNIFLISIEKSEYTIPYSTPVPINFLPDNETNSEANVVALHNIIVENSIDIVLNQCAHASKAHILCYCSIQGTSARLVSALHFCPNMRKLLYKYPCDRNIFTLKENATRLLKCVAYKFPFSLYTLKDVRCYFKKLYAESARVVILSQRFIPEYIEMGWMKDSTKLFPINNMLSFDLIDTGAQKENKILFCARMTNQKRPERALYVWQKLQNKLPDWSLDFVGDGSLLERLKSISKKLGLKNIEFHGFKNPQEFYMRSRIFLMTSDFEGWPLTLFEAMQNRCVPIAIDTYSSVRDIIDNGINGFLIPQVDCSLMAKRAFELATNQELWNNMSQAAFDKTRFFTPKVIADEWMKLFEEIRLTDKT